jgi:hypothetical protein|tara:strand:- start:767 stop:970 length:204 start_codon:yes stop_codon:yes gene_type:complete
VDLAQLVNTGNFEKRFITGIARTLTLLRLLDLSDELGSLLLEKLAVGVIILERNSILLHDIVVKELG